MMNLKNKWKSFTKGSKGSIFDSLTAIVFAIPFIVIVVTFLIIYQSTGDALEDFNAAQAGTDISDTLNESSQPMINNADAYPKFWDLLIVGVIFFVWIIALISAFILGNNSAFFIVYVIISIASIVLGVAVKSALVFFLEDSTINTWTAAMPATLWLANNYIIISFIFVIGLGFILYLKR